MIKVGPSQWPAHVVAPPSHVGQPRATGSGEPFLAHCPQLASRKSRGGARALRQRAARSPAVTLTEQDVTRVSAALERHRVAREERDGATETDIAARSRPRSPAGSNIDDA